MIRYYCLLFLFIHFSVSSQTPSMKWVRSITSPGKTYFPGFSAALPNDGLAIAGSTQRTYSPGTSLFILSLDSLGNVTWTDSIVTINSSTLGMTDMLAMPDGEIVVAGEYSGTVQCSGTMYTSPNTTGRCSYLARFKDGVAPSLISISNMGEPDIAADGMGNILLASQLTGMASGLGSGWTSIGAMDAVICKISPANTVIWSKQISGNTAPGKLFYDPSGQILYFGTFIDTLFFDSFQYSAQQNGAWNSDQFMLVFNDAGSIINKHISTIGLIVPTQVLFFGNEFIMTAPSPWNHGMDVALQKTDTSAASIWYRWLSGGYAESISMHHIGTTENNSFWAVGSDHWYTDYGNGTSRTDLIIRNYSLTGNLISSDSFNLAMDNFPGNASTSSTPGNLFYCGMFDNTLNIYGHSIQGQGAQMFVFRLSSHSTVGINEQNTRSPRLFPNPSSGKITIVADQLQLGMIRIYDIEGKIVFEKLNEPTNEEGNLQVELKSGLYLIHLIDENGIIDYKQKLIIER